jgi:hypothetical protein
MGRCDGRVIHFYNVNGLIVQPQYSQRHNVTNHCDRRITPSDTDKSLLCSIAQSILILWLDNQSIDIVKLFLAELNHTLQVTNGHKNL